MLGIKCFKYITPSIHKKLQVNIIIFIIYVRKLRIKEIKLFAQSHMANNCYSQD